jgi:hypothetical protein
MRRSTDAPSMDVVTAMVINPRNNGERRYRKVGRRHEGQEAQRLVGMRPSTIVTPRMTPTWRRKSVRPALVIVRPIDVLHDLEAVSFHGDRRHEPARSRYIRELPAVGLVRVAGGSC